MGKQVTPTLEYQPKPSKLVGQINKMYLSLSHRPTQILVEYFQIAYKYPSSSSSNSSSQACKTFSVHYNNKPPLHSTMAKNTARPTLESNTLASLDQKLAMAKRCSREGVVAGAKAAVVATIATAIPTLASARMLPWARANLNHTAQALIISTVAGAAYFIVADKTILATARRNSFKQSSVGSIDA